MLGEEERIVQAIQALGYGAEHLSSKHEGSVEAEVKLLLEGMTCSNCAHSIRNCLEKIDGVTVSNTHTRTHSSLSLALSLSLSLAGARAHTSSRTHSLSRTR
jgi:copper chaperone CopZ